MSVKKSLKNKKLWGGRFEEATSPFVERFTSSVSFDNSLYQYDIDGSIAHAKMLEKVGTLTKKEVTDIIGGLEEIREEISNQNFEFFVKDHIYSPLGCLLYTSPSPRDLSTSRMPSSA